MTFFCAKQDDVVYDYEEFDDEYEEAEQPVDTVELPVSLESECREQLSVQYLMKTTGQILCFPFLAQ